MERPEKRGTPSLCAGAGSKTMPVPADEENRLDGTGPDDSISRGNLAASRGAATTTKRSKKGL